MKQQNYFGVGIALGAGIGTAFGVALESPGTGLALEMAVGIIVGVIMNPRKKYVTISGLRFKTQPSDLEL